MADDYSADTNTSGTIAVGGSAVGVIDASYDSDWFRVALVAGTTYQFALGGALAGAASAAAMPTLALVGESTYYNVLHTDQVNLGGPFVMRYQPLVSGTFFLAVNGGTATGGYAVSATALAKDDHPDGASPTDQLALGGHVGGALEVAGDHDAFVVNVEAGKTYTLSVSGVGGAGAALPVVSLDSAPGVDTVSTAFGATDAGTTSFTATATGYYYAVVHDVDPLHGIGAYVLNFSAAHDDYAANPAGAGALALGGAKLAGAIDVAGDVDWFKVSLPAGQNAAFLLGDSSGQLVASVVDASGATLGSALANQAGGKVLTWSAPSAGDYYIQVQSPASPYGATSSYTGAYSMQAMLLGADDFSADNHTTGLLAVGATIAGTFSPAYDTDWIKVQLQAGGNYTFGLTSVSAFGASAVVNELTLYNASGQNVKLAYADAGANPLLSYQATVSGDYFIGVAAASAIGTSYQLTSYGQHADAVAADVTTTATLAPGQLLSNVIDTPVDHDWFKITTAANDTYTITLTGALGGGGTLGADGDRPTLTLFDASGIAQTDAFNFLSPVTLSFFSSVATTYYVQVGATGFGTGTYTLGASDNTHALPDTRAPVFKTLAGPTTVGALGADLVVSFDETVLRGDGTISLRLASGALVETFDAKTSSHLSFAGNQLTLDPGADLLPGTDYVLELGAASVQDSSGNAYAGVTSHALHTAAIGVKLVGGAANDVFHATEGNDNIDGGAGLDTVVYPGRPSDYAITQGILGDQVRSYAGTQSVDALVSIERLVFDSAAIAYDIDGDAGQVYRLYQAAFDRTPDAAGVGYWIAQADHGMGTQAVAAAFAASAEFATLYGAHVTDAQFVTQVYQNVLHRTPDAPGLAYWTDALAHGGARSDALVAFSESAENQIATFAAVNLGISYTPFL